MCDVSTRPIQGVPAGAMKDAIVAPETESTGLQDLRGIPLKRRKASRAVVRTGRFPLGLQRPTLVHTPVRKTVYGARITQGHTFP